MDIHSFSGFSIKPASKHKSVISSTKKTKYVLYCKPVKKDGVWYAHINTKGMEGYKDITILPFTKKSLITRGRTHVFSVEKDKTNHYEHIVRNYLDVRFPTSKRYTTLCPTSVYKGTIVKLNDNTLQFDMIDYIGHISYAEKYLRTSRKESEEVNE